MGEAARKREAYELLFKESASDQRGRYATEEQRERWLRHTAALTEAKRVERAEAYLAKGAAVEQAILEHRRSGATTELNAADPGWYSARAEGVLKEFDIAIACANGKRNEEGGAPLGTFRKTCEDCGVVSDKGLHCGKRLLCPHCRGVYLARQRARATKAFYAHDAALPKALASRFLGRNRHELNAIVLTLPQENSPDPEYRTNTVAKASGRFVKRYAQHAKFYAALEVTGGRKAAWFRFYDEMENEMISYEAVERLFDGAPEMPTSLEYAELKRSYQEFRESVNRECERIGHKVHHLDTLEIEPEKVANVAVATGFIHPHVNVLIFGPLFALGLIGKWWREALEAEGFFAAVVNAPYMARALYNTKTGKRKTIGSAVAEAVKYIIKDVVQPGRDENGEIPPLDETSPYGNLMDPRIFAIIYNARAGKRSIRTSVGFWDVLGDDKPERKPRKAKAEGEEEIAKLIEEEPVEGVGASMAGGSASPWKEIKQRPNKRYPSRCSCGSCNVKLSVQTVHPDAAHKVRIREHRAHMHHLAMKVLDEPKPP